MRAGDPEGLSVRRRALSRSVLPCILALGIVLRLLGAQWGLPGKQRIYSYHPDEHNIMDAVGNMKPARLDFHPGFFDLNPSFYYYMAGASLAVAAAVGYVTISHEKQYYYIDHPEQLTRIYRVWRLLSLLLAVGTTLNFYFIGVLLFRSKAAGWWAALSLAIAPLHVVCSHFGELSLATAFWLSAAWIFVLLYRREDSFVWILLGALAMGLSMATKYDAVLFLFVLLPSVFLVPTRRSWGKDISLVLLVCVAGFLAGCPYALLDFPKFADQIARLFVRIRGAAPDVGCLSLPFGLVGYGLGGTLAVLSFIGLLWGGLQHKKQAWLSGLFVILYLFIAARSCLNHARYENEILPFLIPWSFLPLQWAAAKIRGRWIGKFLVGLMLLAVCLPPFLLSAAFDKALLTPDPRDLASDWMLRNISAGSVVGTARGSSYYTPPALYQDLDRWVKSPYEIHNLDCSTEELARQSPAYLVLNRSEYKIEARVDPGADAQADSFKNAVMNGYDAIARFNKDPEIFGKTFPRTFYRGHDMQYPFNEILILKKKAA